MESLFKYFPNHPKNEQAKNAFAILCSTHETVSSLFSIFKNFADKKQRQEITEQEQDLLRAILLFATSGIDSMVKQLIRDALPVVVCKDEGAAVVFSAYIEKEISKRENLNIKLLTGALISGSPKEHFINYMIMNLTSNSLQSKDELLKIASYFNISSNTLTKDFNLLKLIFEVRNQLAHEMDFNYKTKCRRVRNENDMISYTTEILRIAQVFLKEVDEKL